MYHRYFFNMLYGKMLIKKFFGYSGLKCTLKCRCCHIIMLYLFIFIRSTIVGMFIFNTANSIFIIFSTEDEAILYARTNNKNDTLSDIVFWLFLVLNYILISLFFIFFVRYQYLNCTKNGCGKPCC